ncbi:probable inactive ATP-dependent zinc metalloprotease FTSHI 1, chloroplastic [Andrographis paniculata]|uniref:probable inactive ATP-dependent zinc metalloprotease FTSHI 1, chloroplastic n=1 Tax=Andrographis paniculata TaxID=175694 RepID=UPI0021E919F3|nr:probable inactive ATP-dependent zinc metalloprotease FTSHI 1, chloroplastic [Andrographis paniculata]
MYAPSLGISKPSLINFPTVSPSKRPNRGFHSPLKTREFRICTRAVSKSGSNSEKSNEDFVSRVLRENPSQVEPRYLIGDKLYTSKEKEESLNKRGINGRLSEILSRLNLRALVGQKDKERGSEESDAAVKPEGEGEVYLKDLLREYKGKLYVPEQVFGVNLSEEEEFVKNVKELPRMSYEDFQKYLMNDKIKLVSFKEDFGISFGTMFKDFVVDLKDIPGEKSLHSRRWSMRLDAEQAREFLETYKGPRNEIEKQTTSWVGKLPEYPSPVASNLSSRVMVELGVITAVMTAAAVVVGGFLASAAFAITCFVFFAAAYVIWPLSKPFLKLFFGIVFGILERVWENVVDFLGDGGFFSKVYEVYRFGGVAASIEMLKPILMVFVTMVLLVRFTLSRRPKNFRKWDIWQGIEFSQSKPQARVDGSTGVMFSDVAGIEEAVEELQELVRYLKTPELFDKMGIKPPHGVLLEGPPGCGKTLVAKAIAGEAGVPFYQMAGSEFVEVLVGVGSARIRDLFKRAKVNKPSVIFIDEIDALATRRQGTFQETTDHLYNAATQERETTLNQLLIELDGFDTGKGVIFLGATNRMDLLDPALLRPGRFDRKIRIRPPNAKGRLDILKVHARKVKLSNTVDLSSYANNLPGWSGAKLAQLLQEAALVAVRKGHSAILHSDMDDAVDRLTVGPRRVGIDLGHQGQSRRATTEVGTALTSHLLRRIENANIERCDRVSINPRGQTLSQVVFHRLNDESYIFERKPQLLQRLQVLLGGRAAEEVIFGRNTSKASVSYLADASWLARKIITIWNIDDPMTIHGEPPPWIKRPKFVGPRIDFEGSLYDDYDLIEPPINFELEGDVARRTEQLMHEMYGKTVDLLRQHKAALLKTVKVLVDRKEISGDEIDYILDKYPAQTPTRLVLEEQNPGSLPALELKGEERGDLEYTLLSS